MGIVIIEAEGLTKSYRRLRAVDGVSFTAQPGRVTGLIGPNGAGKSTVMRTLVGLERPDAGRALLAGRPYAQLREPAREVGALLDAGWAHPGRTGEAHLRAVALLGGVPRRRVAETLELVGLREFGAKAVGGYSLGMRQRLGIAAALLGEPRALILDEPMNGLDPTGMAWLRGLLRRLRSAGTTVLISSHLLSELQQTADDVVFLDRGRVLATGSVSALTARYTTAAIRVSVAEPERLAAVLRQAGVQAAPAGPAANAGDRDDALIVTGVERARLADLLFENGLRPLEFTPVAGSLDEVYAKLVDRAGEEAGDADVGGPGVIRAGRGEAR